MYNTIYPSTLLPTCYVPVVPASSLFFYSFDFFSFSLLLLLQLCVRAWTTYVWRGTCIRKVLESNQIKSINQSIDRPCFFSRERFVFSFFSFCFFFRLYLHVGTTYLTDWLVGWLVGDEKAGEREN